MNVPDPIVKTPPILLLNGGRPHMNHSSTRGGIPYLDSIRPDNALAVGYVLLIEWMRQRERERIAQSHPLV